MKTVFTLSADSAEYKLLAMVMVSSAQVHSIDSLHCLYEGRVDALSEWMQRRNVRVITFESSISREIAKCYRGRKDKAHAKGAYLRLEIPHVLAAHDISDEF